MTKYIYGRDQIYHSQGNNWNFGQMRQKEIKIALMDRANIAYSEKISQILDHIL